VALDVYSLTGELGQFETEAIKAVVSIVLQVMALPFQQLIIAGGYIAVAEMIHSDKGLISRLYLSIRPAINGLLYAVLMFMVSMALMLVLVGPVAGAGVFLLLNEHWVFGLIVFGVGILLTFPLLIYIGLGMQMGVYAAVLDNRLPLEALRISWAMARGARLSLFITNFGFTFLAALGICFCCVGAILIYGIQIAGLTAAWMHCSRSIEESEQWAFTERWSS
jgi:hypothetical protein